MSIAPRAEDLIEPFAHLARSLVRERHRQDLAWPDLAHFDEIRHAMGQHARLARPRTGQDKDRSFGGSDRLTLCGIQAFQQSTQGYDSK
jgi:hypothetical protein